MVAGSADPRVADVPEARDRRARAFKTSASPACPMPVRARPATRCCCLLPPLAPRSLSSAPAPRPIVTRSGPCPVLLLLSAPRLPWPASLTHHGLLPLLSRSCCCSNLLLRCYRVCCVVCVRVCSGVWLAFTTAVCVAGLLLA
ncbi:hypothetical protein VPH35_110981 [Triticum aestivum]